MAKIINDTITAENVFDVDVPKLALDSRFGSLVFENASKKLSKAQKWLKEAHDLKYTELLLPTGIGQIDTLTNQLVVHLEWLRVFDIGAVTNPKDEHDQFNSRIDSWFNGVFTQLSMGFLPFLREERRRENPDEKQFDEEIKKVVQIRSDLEEGLKNVREETQKIRSTDKAVGTAKGERASVRLAQYFENEATKYQMSADDWYLWLKRSYGGIIAVVLGFGGWYWFGTPSLTWQSGVAKLVFVATLWYGLSFLIRNYNINSHLAAVNRHRAAVARTLEDFIASSPEDKTGVINSATDAMFKHTPIGFVSKTEKETGSPIYEIINNIMGARNGN
jgi:hypothetical protein